MRCLFCRKNNDFLVSFTSKTTLLLFKIIYFKIIIIIGSGIKSFQLSVSLNYISKESYTG